MMKVNISMQNKSCQFDIESNLPEHEAFEVLRAFTISAFENVPEPLIFVFRGSDSEFHLQDPKDWKEGMQKHFKGDITLEILTDQDSDSEDSWNVVTENGEVMEKEDQPAHIPEEVEISEDLKSVEVINDDQGVIGDYDEDEDLKDKEQEKEEEEEIEGKPQQSPCQSMKQKAMQFVVDMGTENVQNIVAVAHMLLSEGAQLGDAIRTALDSSEAVSEHPLVKEILPHLDMFVAQAGCFTQTLLPFLRQIDIDGIIAMIPNIVDTITRALSGEQDVELDIAPIFQMMNPMMMQQLQNMIPGGQERVFSCDAMNPFKVFEEAKEAVQQEFEPEPVIHRGITCDRCDMSPIVGVRYKSVLRGNYDLCEKCEVNHDPNDPLIKIKVPMDQIDMLPGLNEFSQSVGAHTMRIRRGCGGRRRGRGGRRRGRGGFRRCMREMMARRGGNREEVMTEVMQNGGPHEMMRRFIDFGRYEHVNSQQQEKPEQAENAEHKYGPFRRCRKKKPKFGRKGCPWKQRHCKKELPEEFRADPAQAAEAMEAQRVAEQAEELEQALIEAEKQRRLEEIEKKTVELTERKFQLAELRESMKKSKFELKAMKKQNKSAEKQFKQIQEQSKKAKQLARQTQQQCEEIFHLDLAERANLKPGVSQLKTWKVKNTGKTIWAGDTVAVLCKGNKSMVTPGFEKVVVGTVEPNDVAYIRVMLTVPEDVGDYSITYRLCAPVTGKFGKPLRTIVSVEEEQEFIESPQASAIKSEIANAADRKSDINALPALIEDDFHIDGLAEEIVEPVQPAQPAFQYPEELNTMLEFGFAEEACKNALIASNGNTENAVNMLLMA